MAEDANANIRIDIDTTAATAALKALQSQIARFHTEMARGGAVAGQNASKLQQDLVNSINAGGQFQAGMTKVQSTTEAFTTALEKNKLSMGQYFRYAGASTKTFGRFFRGEFETITKVATERVKDLQTQYVSMGRDANGALKAIKVRPLTLDMNNLATQTMITAQKQQLYNQLLKQGSTNLLNFGKNTQWAGRQLMVGFTLPLTLFASTAAKSFMEIEKQVIRIRRVYGDFSTTVAETDQMIDSIKTLAGEYTKYGVAVSDTLGLAAEAAAAGKSGQELLAQISQATRLAVLGNVEQTQALETTMSVTNAFGVATEDLASKIDFLNAVENQSVTSIEDLTVAIPKAGPVVQQLGGNVEDLAFFLTAMKEGGINASEGANALKSGLAALINPTGKAKEMLQGFGINIDKIVNSNKGDIQGLVIDFASALDTLDPLSRARAIEQLFGKFQFSRLSTLFQNVIGEGTQASRVLELTKATTQELAILSQRELKKVEDTTTYKFEKAFADFQAALAPVGEQFLKAITPVIEFGTKLLNQFNNMSDGAKSFAVILTTVVAGVGPVLLMTVGLVANGVANLIKMFQALGGIFKKSGADTTVLGMQTEYMTQQQLEAAAVAASLNQSHSKLSQTFSVEAAALNNLTLAYQKAVTAQRGFAMPGGRVAGSAAKPKTYASGVVSVPGPKGKGDVVPAMLSPGEAVIPAKMAKKYGSLINGMIGNNIPGYEQGLKTYTNAVMYLPSKMNADMRPGAKAGGVDASKLASSIRAGGAALQAPLVEALAKSMGAKTQSQVQKIIQDNPELKKIAGRISTGVATEVGSLTGKVTDADLEKIAKKQIMANVKGTQFAGAAQDFLTRKTTFEDPTVRRLKGTSTGGRGKFESMGRSPIDTGGQGYRQKSGTYKKIFEMFGGRNVQNYDLAHITAAETLPASKVKGTSTELRAAKANIKNKTEQISLGKHPQTGANLGRITVPVGMSSAEKRVLYEAERGKAISSKGERSSTRGQKAPVTQALTPAQKRQATIAAKKEAVVRAAADAKAKRDATNAKRREQYAAKKAALIPPPKKPGIGSRIASGVRGGMKRMGGMGGMGIGMGLSGAGMVAGMMGNESLAGGLSTAGNIAMAVSGIAMLIPMLKTFTIAVAGIAGVSVAAVASVLGIVGAIGLLAFLAYQHNEEMKKIAKETKAQVDSLGASRSSMQKMAEAQGKVLPSDIIEQQRADAIAGIKRQPGEVTAGETYLSTEAGTALSESVRVATEKGLGEAFTATQVSQQLAAGIANGLISADEANSIADALGTSLKNKKLAVDIKGNLTELQSPSGKEALGDGLDLKVNLIMDVANSTSSNGAMETLARAATTESVNINSRQFQAAGPTSEQEAAAIGMTASNMQTRISVTQQMLDALDLQYQEGNISLKKYNEGRKELLNAGTEAYKQNFRDIQAMTDAQKNSTNELLGTSITDKFKGTGQETAANLALANAATLNTTAEITIKTSLDSGTLSPTAFNNLFSTFDGSEAQISKAINLDVTYGSGTAELIGQLAPYIGKTGVVTLNTFLNAEGTSLEEGQKVLDIISMASATGEDGINTSATLTFISNNADRVLTNWQSWEGMSDEEKTVRLQFETNGFSLVMDQWKKYAGLKDYQQKVFRQIFTKEILTIRSKFTLADGAVFNLNAYMDAVAKGNAYTAAMNAALATPTPDTTTTPDPNNGGGGGGTASTEDPVMARLQKRLAKQTALLNFISLKEAKINKRFDERKKALEEISKLNGKIAEQQRGQLDVADALTRGDIASAARAVQAERVRAAALAHEQQMLSLERQRQAELANVTVKGKTRREVESKIDRLNIKIGRREYRTAASGGMMRGYSGGGMMKGYSVGGKVMSYFADGGSPLGSDTIPAMLTPGEFVIKRPAVQNFGVKNLQAINSGSNPPSGVYNYSISVNVSTEANPDQIARAVAQNVRRTESYRIRGNKL